MKLLKTHDDHVFAHIGLFLLFIFVDQLSKQLAIRYLEFGERFPFLFFSLTLVGNPGASFGILPQSKILLLVIAFVALILCFWFYVKFPKNRFALIVIAAGIIGNVLDRFIYGFVIDMIDFHVWPIFNLADSMIFIGTFIVIIYLWKEDMKKKR